MTSRSRQAAYSDGLSLLFSPAVVQRRQCGAVFFTQGIQCFFQIVNGLCWTARAAPPFFPALTTACPEDRFCACIQQAYQRPSCLRSAHPSAVFQPVRLTTQPRGEIYEISISKQHPALCMQPEGIISGDFSTESVHQLCTEYACPSLDCRTDISWLYVNDMTFCYDNDYHSLLMCRETKK